MPEARHLLVRVQHPDTGEATLLLDLARVGTTAAHLLAHVRKVVDAPKDQELRCFGYNVRRMQTYDPLADYPYLYAAAPEGACDGCAGESAGLELWAATFETGCCTPGSQDMLLEPISMLQKHAKQVQPLRVTVGSQAPKRPAASTLEQRPASSATFQAPQARSGPDHAPNGPADEDAHVFIQTLTGRKFRIDKIWPGMTCEELKARIQDAEGIPPDQQRLIFGGTQLDDPTILSSAGIISSSTLTLVQRLRGGMYHSTSGRDDMLPNSSEFKVYVRMEDGRELVLDMQAGSTSKDLCKMIRRAPQPA